MEHAKNSGTAMVLVVDDEPDLLELYSKRLKRVGFEVATARNGQEAIDHLQLHECDAVVCDINMPVRSGFDVFEYVRLNLPERMPFIFVTGHGEGTPEMKKALSLGADGVYSKPLSSKVLIEHLQKLCGIVRPVEPFSYGGGESQGGT